VSALRVALRRPAFWYLALAFALLYINHGMVVTHLLPLLHERELPLEYAVLAASLIGPMQVAGRLAMMAVERWISMIGIAIATFVSVTLAAVCLYAAAWQPLLLGLFALLQGAGIGVTSISRPVVTAQLLGRASFGQISGAVALFQMSATAVAPSIGGVLWALAGYDFVIGICGAASAAGLILFLLAARQPSHPAG
jgi:predicted MFS family arabinose efflux permease